MRQRIVDAALELFGTDGFENTTVRKIGRRCGVTDALLYYYFPSKRHILDAIWDIPQARILHRVDPARPLTIERLLELVDQMISGSIEREALIRLMIRQSLSGDRAALAFRARTMQAWRNDVHGHLAIALPEEEAALNREILVSIVFGATFVAMAEHGPAYAKLAASDDFRRLVHELVLTSLPFCRDLAER